VTDGIGADFSELAAFAEDLGEVPKKTPPLVRKAVEVTARHVKDDWRKGADRTGLGGYAADVDYDMKYTDGAIGAEVGPTPGDSGSFGLVEDARGDVRSAPQHAGRDAARKNEADFINGLAKALEDSL
jgi:hypothetical protein